MRGKAKSPSAPRSAVKKEEDEEDVVVEDGGTPARPARPDPSQQILPEELEVPGETMEQRRAREDLILDKAAVMEAILHNSKLKPWPEPKTVKYHWDHVVDEAMWLAKEFQKERKTKLAQVKRTAVQCLKSNKDFESRERLKLKDEEQATVKKAKWIATQVMAFWKKAEKLVTFQYQREMERKKKVVLDKHLEFLVGQTERYSSVLAENLRKEQEARAAKEAALGGGGSQAPPAPKPAPAPGPSQPPPMTPITAGNTPAAGPSTSGAGTAVGEGVGAPKAPLPPAPAPAHPLDEGDDEYVAAESEEDDEGTLEEDELRARQEGVNLEEEQRAELGDLQAEADEDIAVILARYEAMARAKEDEGAGDGAGPSTAPQIPEPADADEEMHGEEAEEEDDEEEEEDLLHMLGEEDDAEEPKGGPSVPAPAADPSTAGPSTAAPPPAGEEMGDDEYVAAESEEDDEGTLEEDELRARQEGVNLEEEQRAELGDLQAEADMSLEEILAKYYAGGQQGGSPGPAAAAEKEEEAAAEGENEEEEEDEDEEEANEREHQEGLDILGDLMKDDDPSAPPTRVHAVPSEPMDVDPDASRLADEERRRHEEAQTLSLGMGEDEGAKTLEALAREMAEVLPTGNTLETTRVRTKVPFLLKHSLREYQHIGLDWLVTLGERKLNGILADEMGLGKTIMTISLLAHLACEKGDWGPHLIVVPTSVMLNWEIEFKKWCPAFKVLTYFGSTKQRAEKRKGWSKPNAFHVCITSYTLISQDAKMFKRKKWKYLILDEAHMIKNWRSQRWQTLLNFNTKRRLLITGTPLQNDLMELWSLMHFLMPHVFQSHDQFKQWFSNPLTGMVEGTAQINQGLVDRLHGVLRPFLLRRLKKDVEKSLPPKFEHVVYCNLSKRQRTLYEDYMASSETRSKLTSGNFLGVANVLMQLRKVCNHPDLFEGRPIVSAFDQADKVAVMYPVLAYNATIQEAYERPSILDRSLLDLEHEDRWAAREGLRIRARPADIEASATDAQWEREQAQFLSEQLQIIGRASGLASTSGPLQVVRRANEALIAGERAQRRVRGALLAAINEERCHRAPVYGRDLVSACRVLLPSAHAHILASRPGGHLEVSAALQGAVKTVLQRCEDAEDMLRTFLCYIPPARATPPEAYCARPDPEEVRAAAVRSDLFLREALPALAPFRTAQVRRQLFFPDRRLIQFDCGKLQELAVLLRRLKQGGHRCLIFTQMSRMLDVLEIFLNLHAYTYLRLDGSTKPESRQIMMQRFNTDPKWFCFILSTRSGGVGINLTGADTVVFYDSDWNPAMDQQAQDRCHRIGQTREVHIYRLISTNTIEENILKKSDQKRHLDLLAIQSGGFNTEGLLQGLTKDIFGLDVEEEGAAAQGGNLDALRQAEDREDVEAELAAAREEAADREEMNVDAPPAEEGDEGDEGEGGAKRDEAAGGTPAKKAPAQATATATATPAPAQGGAEALTAEDADLFDDLKAFGGKAVLEGSADVSLASLLRPVELLAVRYLEMERPWLKADQATVQDMDREELDLDELDRLKAEADDDIDDDPEGAVVEDWDEDEAKRNYHVYVIEAVDVVRELEEKRERERIAREAREQARMAAHEKKKQAEKVRAQRAAHAAAAAARRAKHAAGIFDTGGQVEDDFEYDSDSSLDSEGAGAGHKKKRARDTDDTGRGGAAKKPKFTNPLHDYTIPWEVPVAWDPAEDLLLLSLAIDALELSMINPLAEQPLDPRFFTAAAAALSAGLSRHMAPEVTILMGTTGGAGAQTDQLWQGPLSAAARGPEDVRARMMDLIAAYKVAKGLPVPEDLSQLHCTLAPLQARDYKMYILQATPQPNAEAVAASLAPLSHILRTQGWAALDTHLAQLLAARPAREPMPMDGALGGPGKGGRAHATPSGKGAGRGRSASLPPAPPPPTFAFGAPLFGDLGLDLEGAGAAEGGSLMDGGELMPPPGGSGAFTPLAMGGLQIPPGVTPPASLFPGPSMGFGGPPLNFGGGTPLPFGLNLGVGETGPVGKEAFADPNGEGLF